MHEAGHTPLCPAPQTAPTGSAPKTALLAESPRRETTTVANAPSNARGGRDNATQAPREKQVSEAFASAKEVATRTGHEIRRQFGERLTHEESLKLVTVFRAGVVQRRRAGRQEQVSTGAQISVFDLKREGL